MNGRQHLLKSMGTMNGWFPSTFMRTMNHVLQPYIGKFVAVYIDDILIYNYSREHLAHLRQVLETVRADKPYINLKKCKFLSDQANFLGFIVSSKGIAVDPEKVRAILD